MSLFEKDRAPAPKTGLEDGIYFDIPDKVYHKIPRLSSSGIKDILISLPNFWARSWMNPEREHNDDDTEARIEGRARHAAIFESETFGKNFVSKPDFSQFDGILLNDTMVKDELKKLGQTQSKKGEGSMDRAYRLRECGFSGPIRCIIEREFYEDLDGRQVIDSSTWDRIASDIQRIKDNPEIAGLVTGGASEVTILWTCPETQIPMKARIDKLKSDCFIDLKSFANKNGKPVNQAILDQVQYYKYYLSMRVYQRAIQMISELDLDIQNVNRDRDRDLVDALRSTDSPLPPILFFQEKGGIPNILARRLKLHIYPDGVDEQSIGAEDHDIRQCESVLCRKADIEIAHAKRLYQHAMEIYGEDSVWYPLDMIGEIRDDDFRDYFLDSVPS